MDSQDIASVIMMAAYLSICVLSVVKEWHGMAIIFGLAAIMVGCQVVTK